jgi:hypothetical protein
MMYQMRAWKASTNQVAVDQRLFEIRRVGVQRVHRSVCAGRVLFLAGTMNWMFSRSATPIRTVAAIAPPAPVAVIVAIKAGRPRS